MSTGGPEGTLSRSLTDQQRTDDRLLRDAGRRNDQANDRLLRDAERRNETAAQQEARRAETERMRGVAAQIDEVLANPNAPGAADRLQQLHADLTDISQQGFKRSSEIRARLQRTGLLRAGLASKEQNVDALVQALARVDPEKPEEMRAVLQIISKPRLIDRLLEYQYVNMLSSPVTHGVNTISNAAQLAGRLFLQNPLEYVYSGGRSTGVGAAFQGAAQGAREGWGEAKQIMRTGTSSDQINRATELGDYSHVSRELLTEKFGKVGAIAHAISTRPLAAMDALFGGMAYASAAEQYAQRTADRLLKSGSESVKGMSREAARQHVMANIWDHPEVIEQAGKIEDYTLLKGRGTTDLERNFRALVSSRVPDNGGVARQGAAFLANQIMPFTGVPINSAKQGFERTVGVPVNVVRAARAYARGDVERGAELASKATIGAAGLGLATVLAMNGDITGEGPSDPGQRSVWELTHRRNSFRVPGTDAWISWEGSPMAIPFGMVAGAAQGIENANKRSAQKGQTDRLDVAGSAIRKGAQGAFQGFASQSFIKALGDQYQLITGDQTGLGMEAASIAGTASRFVPASGMLNFMARVGDSVERDAGKPQKDSDVPENVGARIASRLPGIGIPGTNIGLPSPRQQIDPKLNAYGEPQKRIPPAPYYRGAGDMAGDPITQNLETAGAGAPGAPTSIHVPGVTGSDIPLTVPERHTYQQYVGEEYRKRLESTMGSSGRFDKLPPAGQQKMLDDIATAARDAASARLRKDIGPAGLRARDIAARQPAGVR
jgi:hypothetical protein